MTENKQQRPFLIASFSALFAAAEIFRARGTSAWNSRALYGAFRTHNSRGSREMPRPRTRFLSRIVLNLRGGPVDITVDNEAPLDGEKPQQNQHFKYQRAARYSYRPVNKTLIPPPAAQLVATGRAAPTVTPVWNMHRSGAACSLNVTSIGICLSSQQSVVTAMAHFSPRNVLPPLTHPECGTIVKRTFGMLAAHEPRVFPGIS
jgi:hypothetical protein